MPGCQTNKTDKETTLSAPFIPNSLSKIEILVIEDEPVIQQTLETFLEACDYRFEIANGGVDAFKRLQEYHPELILCDIMMPGMTGYEVCTAIKDQEHLKDIPLIFLTALHSSDQVIQGFRAGAVDYITKPFNFSELDARIKTHLELARGRRKLIEYTQRLETLNQEKDQFLGIAAHDLKNPLATILLRAQMTQMKAETITPTKIIDSMEQICHESERMLKIISNLLDINRLESGAIDLKLERFDAIELSKSLLDLWDEKTKVKNIEIQVHFPHENTSMSSDKDILFQILENLLSNAVKYSPHNRRIWFEVKTTSDEICFMVRDQGPGLSQEDQRFLFQKFKRLSSQPTGGESSNGLGLSIVKYLVEQLQGNIGCQSETGQGACFSVSFPLVLEL